MNRPPEEHPVTVREAGEGGVELVTVLSNGAVARTVLDVTDVGLVERFSGATYAGRELGGPWPEPLVLFPPGLEVGDAWSRRRPEHINGRVVAAQEELCTVTSSRREPVLGETLEVLTVVVTHAPPPRRPPVPDDGADRVFFVSVDAGPPKRLELDVAPELGWMVARREDIAFIGADVRGVGAYSYRLVRRG
jgi:hypothetical protein